MPFGSQGAGNPRDMEYELTKAGKVYLIHNHWSMPNTTGATHTMLYTTGTSYAVIVSRIIEPDQAPMFLTITEDVTTTANGTALSTFNANRNVATTSTMSVYDSPTGTAGGTEIERIDFFTGQQKQPISNILQQSEFVRILKPSIKYAMVVTNNSGSTANFQVHTVWYELVPGEFGS